MAKGDPLLSPWLWAAGDYVGLQITISVAFNNSTRAIQSATVHRDDGCQYHTIVFDVPDRGVRIETGIGLGGRGTLWVDDVKLEEVERSTQVTNTVRDRSTPENLGFEIGLDAAR